MILIIGGSGFIGSRLIELFNLHSVTNLDFKNSLKERSEEFYSWASINNNTLEEKYELELSKQLDRIAEQIESIIYND